MEHEGQIAVILDEILDPKISKKTGNPYFQISVKRAGQGTGDLFVTEAIYTKLNAAGAKAGDTLGLIFNLQKFSGTMEARLSDVVFV